MRNLPALLGIAVKSGSMASDMESSRWRKKEVDGSGTKTLPTIRLTTGDGLPKVMVATLDSKAKAPSLFGSLRFHLVRGGEVSDWQSLVILARLRKIDAVACEAGADGCTIKGRDLFWIDAVGVTPILDKVAQVAQVAQGYTGSSLKTAAPRDGQLYLRLRDASDSIVALPAS